MQNLTHTLSTPQILSRSPVMEDFRMASSRVGPKGGIALAAGLSTGEKCECHWAYFNPVETENPSIDYCFVAKVRNS